ncbi:hypothetical protein O181_000581 [Austropuccinia psidii MF-1]|uniref:Uncharacterized protein n=1 Tax=Austropuccinia psidii MF-1 TaxID=1389203 RepID=A0A9Q3B9C3_9BASI|nr:hypothetical protein [Austropuccinia psidii MF-1]
MHNWLEGVLAEHFCFQWGFQDERQERKRANGEGRTDRQNKRRKLTNRSESGNTGSQEASDEDEGDLRTGGGVGGGFMSNRDIELFRKLMSTVVMPRGAAKLPCNLGCAKNGRLKATEWLSLFTLIIPLIIPEVYIESKGMIDCKSIRGKFLQNIGDLVQCTRIVSAQVVQEGNAGRFFNAYN